MCVICWYSGAGKTAGGGIKRLVEVSGLTLRMYEVRFANSGHTSNLMVHA
jgi:hypothetical protein